MEFKLHPRSRPAQPARYVATTPVQLRRVECLDLADRWTALQVDKAAVVAMLDAGHLSPTEADGYLRTIADLGNACLGFGEPPAAARLHRRRAAA